MNQKPEVPDLNMGASSQQNGGKTRKNNRRNRNQRRNNRRNRRSQKKTSCGKQHSGGSYVKSLVETRSGYGYSNGTLSENRLYAGAHPNPTPLRAHGQEQGGGKRRRTRKNNRNNRRNRQRSHTKQKQKSTQKHNAEVLIQPSRGRIQCLQILLPLQACLIVENKV